jgi:hypothetical protein
VTVAVELNGYSNIKGVKSIKRMKKVGCCDLGRGEVWYGIKMGIFLFGNVGFLV